MAPRKSIFGARVGHGHAGCRKALIVSDDPEDRKTLARILCECHFEPVLRSTASEAAAALATGSVGLIFCQETLSGGGFQDVLRAARFAGRNIPVIVCSRFYSTRAYLNAMASGAYDFVTCPYLASDVAWIAEGAIRKSGEPSLWASADAA